MRMQNAEMEFVTFDARDVIATSGPVYEKMGTYYVDLHGKYALYDSSTGEVALSNQNPRSPHDIWLADEGKMYLEPNKGGAPVYYKDAYNNGDYRYFEFWQFSDSLYYWLEQNTTNQ